MENLGRGLTAAKVTNAVYVNWRITGQEWRGTTYNIYRDGVKINTLPLEVSNFSDINGVQTSTYQVAAVVGGVEQPKCAAVSVLPNPYIEIDLRSLSVSGYEINDCTAADLDGDGEMEIIVKRLYPNWSPSSPYFSYIEAYKLDGTFMWAINVGPNIFSDVETNVAAFDFDGDGKAEVFMRTSEGTVFANGDTIKSANGTVTNYRSASWGGENGDYPNHSTYLCAGPEYLSLIDGETGVELDRTDYISRGNVNDWGDNYGHRANKFFFGAPYLDGKKPSLFISRGIYTRIVMKTFDIVDKHFVPRWTFDTQSTGNSAYAYQGNHNYNIADVDGDGRDEIVYGSMVIDDNGQGLYSTGLGHGDAIHTGDLDPYRKGLEVFACLESSPYYGTTLRAAENGQILLQYIKGSDCGRCIAGNWSNAYAGAELAPAGASGGVCSATTKAALSIAGGSQNFRIFWDGDLLDELLDHNMNTSLGKGEGRIDKFNGSSWTPLLTTTGYYSCNYTKGTPCLQADLFGDWREEVIYRSADDTKMRIYFTTTPTNYRIYTLLHDMQYRQAICWQMCGYNQPPHTSFFLGEKEGITAPPPPVISNGKMIYSPDSVNFWANVNGKDILFDISGTTSDTILCTDIVEPKSVTVNSPQDYTLKFTKKIRGYCDFIKQGSGTLYLYGQLPFSGRTELWDGKTVFKGGLENSSIWMNLHAELEATGRFKKNLEMNYASVLYVGGKNHPDTLTVDEKLILKNNSIVQFDLNNDSMLCDRLILFSNEYVASDTLMISGNPVFQIIADGDTLATGDYTLIETQHIDGSILDIKVEGLAEQIVSLVFENEKLILRVENMRAAAGVLWKGDKAGAIWNKAQDRNFTLNGNEAYFAVNDDVTFDETASSKTVNKVGDLFPSSITFNNTSDYIIQGNGDIIGTTTLSKTGTGKLTLRGTNNYTGASIINGGTLAVESMPNLGNSGSIGAASGNANLFVIDNATLTAATAAAITSERAVKIGTNGGTFNTNVNFDWKESIIGGELTKTGNSTLNLYAANSCSKIILKAGSISLKTEEATPGQKIVFEGGTLYALNNISSYSSSAWNIEVAEGKTATVSLDGRCTYTGTLSGAGILNVISPYVRSDMSGNWSAFSGKINVTSDNDGGDFRWNNNYGIANAELNITGSSSSAKISVYNNTGQKFVIGSLTGNANTILNGSHEYEIGNKNLNTTYEGTITGGASLRKVGTGSFILSNANTYTGTTYVQNGYLLATNTTGSATGTGAVQVTTGGCLSGTGTIGGNVTVSSSGIIDAGNPVATSWINKIGTLTLEKNLALQGTAKMSVLNGTGNLSDKFIIKGNATISGKLLIDVVSGDAVFALGAEITLFDWQGSVSGQFSELILPPTVENTEWDTSTLYENGKINVVNTTALENIQQNDYIIEQHYFNLLGIEISQPEKGKIYIINNVYKSGKIQNKIIVEKFL
jgi:autotransporter-associated beta strand protein